MNTKVIEDAKALEEAYLAIAGGDGRMIRQRAGLTLADLSKLVGATFSTVATWERQENFPTLDHALAYGRVLRKLQAQSQEREVV